jgi:3-ketoacyl-CoA synthase
LGWKSVALVAVVVWYLSHRVSPVYLIDFTTFQPPESWLLTPQQLMEAMRLQESFTQDSLDFTSRMLQQSGVGPKTAWPPGMVQTLQGKPTDESVEASRKEAEVYIISSFSIVFFR